ncbi:hypothetical protein ACFQL1_15910 [Halomicroarcula sp. GCM10025709]
MSITGGPPEAGIRPQRWEYIRETTKGQTPSDPDWQPFSNKVMSWWGWEPDAQVEADRSGGDADPVDFNGGSEIHEPGISYRLQQWLVDGSGDPQDALADAMLIDSDNSVKNTHSLLGREEHADGGATGNGVRIFVVFKGATPSDATIPFVTEQAQNPEVELNWQAQKGRVYGIDQPPADTTLWAKSTDDSDTTQTLTVENEGAGTTDSISLNGTTAVQGTSGFSGIDAAELSAECVGDVELYDGDPGGSGTLLLTIKGQDSYEHGEGDLGVPTLGGGSHAASISSPTDISFLGSDYGYSSAGEIAAEIIEGELQVDLGLEDNSQNEGPQRNIHMTGRTTTWSATVAGQTESVNQVVRYLTGETSDIEWDAGSVGTITGPSARMMSPGSHDESPDSGKHQRSLEWESQG